MSTVIIDAAPKSAFFALPPPPLPENSNRTTPCPHSDSILAWAASVHPGPPAPLTPLTTVYGRASPRKFTFGRLSFSYRSRRPSTSSTRSRSLSSSLSLIDTPITSNHPPSSPFISGNNEPKSDLMAFGYASIFVNLSGGKTPVTPVTYKPQPPMSPSPVKSGGMLKRFQSIARSRSLPPRVKTQPRSNTRPSPAVHDPVSVPSKRAKHNEALAVEKKKRLQYIAALPPTILQEAQFRQAMEGGTLEHNIKRIMEEKAKRDAKREAKAKRDGTHVVKGPQVVEGVEAVWRDGEGRLWWDQEEKWEFAHLLAEKPPVSTRVSIDGWVPFGENVEADSILASRRSSCDSDLLYVSSRAQSFNAGGVVRRGRSTVRQRRAAPPAPLQLVPPNPCSKLAIDPEVEEGKREFFADSFQPQLSPCKENELSVSTPRMKKKGSRSNLAGLFKKSNKNY